MRLRELLLVTAMRERGRCNRRRIFLPLQLRDLLRERNYLSSPSLLRDQTASPWYILYATRDRQAFITMVSIPPESFELFLAFFDQQCIVKSGPGRCGRPPRIPHKHAVLGMLLYFYTNAVEHKTLMELFAVPPATISRVLKNAEVALAATPQ